MCEADSVFAIHQAASELQLLTSLLQDLADKIESIGHHFDPEQAARVAADLARLAFDGVGGVADQLLVIEEAAAAA